MNPLNLFKPPPIPGPAQVVARMPAPPRPAPVVRAPVAPKSPSMVARIMRPVTNFVGNNFVKPIVGGVKQVGEGAESIAKSFTEPMPSAQEKDQFAAQINKVNKQYKGNKAANNAINGTTARGAEKGISELATGSSPKQVDKNLAKDKAANSANSKHLLGDVGDIASALPIDAGAKVAESGGQRLLHSILKSSSIFGGMSASNAYGANKSGKQVAEAGGEGAAAGAILGGTASAAKTGVMKAFNKLYDIGKVDVPGFVKDVSRFTPKDTGNFKSDLQNNLKKLAGTRDWNTIRAMKLVAQGENDKANTEAVYHNAEDKTVPLTAEEKNIAKQNTQLKNATQTIKQEGKKNPTVVDQDYQHREALGKNSALEQNLAGKRSEPTQGAMRTTAASSKRAIYQTLTDNSGNRKLVSFKGGRVQDWSGDQPTDMGGVKSAANKDLDRTQFADKTGKVWNVVRATTKDIEANTNDKYVKNAVTTSAIDHVDTIDAANGKDFKTWLQGHPEYDQHIVNGQTKTPPPDFVPINSRYFPGYYADKDTAATINQLVGNSAERTTLDRIVGPVNSAATQFIVANPLIHGRNLITQAFIQAGNSPLFNTKNPILNKIPSGPLAVIRLTSALKDMATPEGRESMLKDYLTSGGHLDPYGKDIESKIASVTKGATKLNQRAMSALDTNIRILTFAADRKAGMDPDRAINEIDTFLGSKTNQGEFTRNFLLFYHWLSTQGHSIGYQASNPIKNIGSITNTAIAYASVLAANAGLAKLTGNPNAKTTYSGELGLVHDAATEGKDIVTKNPSGASEEIKSFISGHTTPVATAGVDQLFGKNLFSGDELNTTGARTSDLERSLFAPAANVSKVSSGKMTIPEAALSEYGTISLPHATGNPAAPNFKTGLPSKINTPGATPAQGTDKTGYQEEVAFYGRKDAGSQALQGNSNAQDAYNDYFTKNYTAQGKPIQNSPAQTQTNWDSLKANPAALAQIAKVEGGGPNPDPIFKLTGNGTIINKNGQQSYASKLQVYAMYQSDLNGSGDRAQLEAMNPWLVPAFNSEQTWFNSLSDKGNAVTYNGPLPGGLTIKDLQYPTLTPAQNSLLNLVSSITGKAAGERSTLETAQLNDAENNPILQQAYNALDTYTNNMRVAKGASPINYGPNEPPQVSEGIADYDAWKTGGGKASDWINAHPDLWNQIETYYATSDQATNAKAGAEAELEGPPTSANTSQLSSAYDLGQYDINKTTNPNGSSAYTLNPEAAYASSSPIYSGSSYSSGSSSGSSYPLTVTTPDTSSIDKLKSLLTGPGTKSTNPKSASIKKSFTKGKQNYHVKKVSMGKTEKLPKLTKYKAPTYVSSKRGIEF